MAGEQPKPAHAVLSRREWLQRLAEAAAVLGFSGGAGDVLAGPAAAGGAAASLPPGLYQPSTEHLAHAFRSDGPYHDIPPGSETDYIQPPPGPYHPRFFTPPEFTVVRRIVELLLGEASSAPGSSAADAAQLAQTLAEWIDLSVFSAAGARRAARGLDPAHRALAAAVEGEENVRHLETDRPEPVCRDGLDWLQKTAQERYQRNFMALAAADQLELLHRISDEHPPSGGAQPGRQLFDLFKREVIRGFYTSRQGLAELDYQGNAFYAESPGCDSKP